MQKRNLRRQWVPADGAGAERSQQLSRRAFLKLSGAALAGTVLAACQAAPAPEAQAPEQGAPAGETVEIVGWTVHGVDPENPQYRPYRDAVMEHFLAKYPDAAFVHMDMGWDEELRQNLVTALLGGTAPDVIVGENYIQPYAESGVFLPMDEMIQDVEDNLIYGTYAAAVVDDKIYGISQLTGCFGFERNPNVIEQAGLDPDTPPLTWGELLEHAALITEAGDGAYYGYTLQGPVGFLIGGILRFAVYMKTAGAELCQGDGCTYPWFNNPEAERVLLFLRDLHRYTPPGLSFNPNEGEVYTQLFQGVSAYQVAGSWHVRWAEDSGLENARYSAIPIPEEDGIPATGVVGNVILSALSSSQHPEESLYFCRCFLEDDVQDLVHPILGRLPSTRSALERLQAESGEANQMFIELLLTADLGVLPQWRRDPQKIWSIYNDMITQLLTTERPVLELMDEAQVEVDKVMQQES